MVIDSISEPKYADYGDDRGYDGDHLWRKPCESYTNKVIVVMF